MPPQYYSTNSLKMAVCLRFTVSCLHRGRVRERMEILVRRGFVSDRATSYHQRT